MSDDLTTRLRRPWWEMDGVDIGLERQEAADAIERLQKWRDKAITLMADAADEIELLRQERNKLLRVHTRQQHDTT